MYDSFEPFQQLEILEFNYRPIRFEVWKGGKMVDSGKTDQIINSTEHYTGNGKGALVAFNDPKLFPILSQENDFDIFITANDRLQLVKVPSSGNGDGNIGISMFKMTIGSTRSHTDFQANEPYCCNLFLKEGELKKITFSFSSPEKLVEFYSD